MSKSKYPPSAPRLNNKASVCDRRRLLLDFHIAKSVSVLKNDGRAMGGRTAAGPQEGLDGVAERLERETVPPWP